MPFTKPLISIVNVVISTTIDQKLDRKEIQKNHLQYNFYFCTFSNNIMHSDEVQENFSIAGVIC